MLHLEWQRRYIDLLDSRLGFLRQRPNIKSIQIVIATHSPLLATDILRDSITKLDGDGVVPAFGAPIQKIINRSFGTPSIGVLAERIIKHLREDPRRVKENIELVRQIDDDFIRQYIIKEAGL